ncbi:MAG TPA: cytochrome P450 [Kofleriaceae bacterium]|jgi:cytochrome P450|nr:cytochrome P450 [Kofleriaceae bacterium]
MQPPPGSLGMPYLGKSLAFLKDPFEFTLAGTRAHGNVWKTRLLGDTVVFFAGPKAFSFFMDPHNFTRQNGSPKFLQDLLHSDAVPFLDGDRFKIRKRLLLAAFSNLALDSYLPGIFQIFARYCDGWADGTERVIVPDLNQLAFDIADRLFAAADPSASNRDAAADFTAMNKGTFAPPINLPFTAYGRAVKARDRLRAYIKRAVAERDGEGSALGVLKAARGPNGEQLAPAELEIELLHFYFAAHAGLAAAIAWSFVVLGTHVELAETLRDEADAVLGDHTPTLDVLDRLVRARAVTREVLRAYPIVPTTFFGIARRDLELDGLAIRAGWKGAGAIWATLQDGATFRDPTTFSGERLGDAPMRQLPHNAFVPQGGGPREGHRCPGEALIHTVVPAFVAWFARRFDLTWNDQDTTAKGGGIGPLPASGVRIAITKRRAPRVTR